MGEKQHCPGLPLSAAPGKRWLEPKFRSKAVMSRWADICDSDSDSDLSEFSSGPARKEPIDQSQQKDSCTQVVFGFGTDKETTILSKVVILTPGCFLPCESDDASAHNAPSVGSLQHNEGTCRPCVFAWTSSGCHHGVDCRFCHFKHSRNRDNRPCRVRRKRFQRRLESVMQWMAEEVDWLFNNPDWLSLVCAKLPQFLQHDANVRSKIERKLVAHAFDLLSKSK